MFRNVSQKDAGCGKIRIGEGGVGESQISQDRHHEHRQEGDQETVEKRTDHRPADPSGGVAENACSCPRKEMGNDSGKDNHRADRAEDEHADDAAQEAAEEPD